MDSGISPNNPRSLISSIVVFDTFVRSLKSSLERKIPSFAGYHLDKFYKCYLATVVSYLVIVIISARLSEHPQWLFAILVIAITGIGLIGTVNHPNMHMTSEELMESKKSARTIVLLEGCIILGCVLLDADMVYISYMAIAVILCAALLCIAKIFKQEVRENEAG